MSDIPRDKPFDSALSFWREGYDYVGRHCRDLGTDIFQARLLGRRFYCVHGADAARMFYEPGRFTRNGALPTSTLHLLQDQGSVATLDAAAHRRRKAMLMSLMTPEHLRVIADLAEEGLLDAARRHVGGEPVRLHGVFRDVLCRAVCSWAGVPFDEDRARLMTRQIGAMIDNAGTVGPPNWAARIMRWGAERYLSRLFADLRTGHRTAPDGSAVQVIADHRDLSGEPLAPAICAVETLNLLRPTVAIARFMTFAVLALQAHPETRPRLAEDDAYRKAFVQEVRRLYPFFPIVAGVAREPFEWREHAFTKGDRFILDLYGTDHDARLWDDPEAFRPERFLGWPGDPFSLIPQGGGDHYANHRCAGEWLTIAVMKAMLRTLVRGITYTVQPQDLMIDRSRMPALPRSGFLVCIEAVSDEPATPCASLNAVNG